MSIFGISKKKLIEENSELAEALNEMYRKFPFDLGEVVYDLQLRGETGRYTKNKPSKEHSLINEVVVDEKNYFKLKARYESRNVFRSRESAEEHLNSLCTSAE